MWGDFAVEKFCGTDMESVFVQLRVLQFFSAAPSYNESILGPTNIRDEEQGEHTQGQLDFTPTYTYYNWSRWTSMQYKGDIYGLLQKKEKLTNCVALLTEASSTHSSAPCVNTHLNLDFFKRFYRQTKQVFFYFIDCPSHLHLFI